MKIKYFFLGNLFALICMSSHAFGSVIVSSNTDKSLYQPWESIEVFVTASNQYDVPITLTFGSNLMANYTMDGVYDWASDKRFVDMMMYLTIPARGSHTWNFQHEHGRYDPGLGIHSVIGEVVGYGQSQPFEVNIIPEPSIFSLLGAGAISLLIYVWRRRKAAA